MPLPLTRFLLPWRYRREQAERRIAELRGRDGDDCARCRRTLRFDLPAGHEQAPRIEPIDAGAGGEHLTNLCLTHGRCNAPGRDHTGEIRERLRPAREAELFAKARSKQAA